eukprot:TRINITY_DN17585_c0_g1_i1.p1 TRINITY_DN17585_c0_g1~~TRINITY_DN17585_c0_g1_i1.p1  ORF type:complete len:601 (+),score=140.97 TRINITY_DN17585_c0_g1_i1:38-1804(+)
MEKANVSEVVLRLKAVEEAEQLVWQQEKVFEGNPDPTKQKFHATWPFITINGRMHLGHAFTFLQADFAVGFTRLLGKECLQTFPFHASGAPILHTAVALREELSKYGDPPQFPPEKKDEFAWYKFLISQGVPPDRISEFTDPAHYQHYFPEVIRKEVTRLGAHVDWRRSFVTTNENPYYDKFIQWVYGTLKRKNLLQFGSIPPVKHEYYSDLAVGFTEEGGEEQHLCYSVGIQENAGVITKALKSMKCCEKSAAEIAANATKQKRWPCTRPVTSGITGHPLIWDKEHLVDSLGDPWLHNYYSTISYQLQGDWYGTTQGMMHLPPEALTNEFWDYVFLGTPLPSGCEFPVPPARLQQIAEEFQYWSGADILATGRDLNDGLLLGFLYGMTQIMPEKHWLKCLRSNGYLLLDGEKMSKSAGMVTTLDESIDLYGSDALRLALAQAWNGELADANFSSATAVSAVATLGDLLACCDYYACNSVWHAEPSDVRVQQLLHSKVDTARAAYDAYEFKAAAGVCIGLIADLRAQCDGVCVKRDLRDALEVAALVLSPLCPAVCEHVWRRVLGNASSIVTHGRWPETLRAASSENH